MMTLEPRKVFVGGLPRSMVKTDDLKAHFARYGEVVDAVVMLSPENGLGRGFGFVEFADEASVLRALDWKEREKHVFDGRRVDVKRAQTRHGQTQPSSNPNADSKKVFVGGLRDNITKDDLSAYFGKFGTINDAVVMYERMTRRPRGFGFVTFDSQEAVNKVLENRFHDLNGTKVETKMAEPREHSHYQNGYYHGSMTGGYRSPANRYGGMYSPHSMPYLFHNGNYFVPAYPYVYAPQGSVNYGYMMNQTASSNDTGMMSVQRSPMVYPNYGRSFVDPVTGSANYLGYPGFNLGSDSKMGEVNANRQRVDISSDSSNLL
ncbi:hypothetical protein EJB05_04284 [Eragrostis curvula]|uniref:RRM domain-containing protein n=1 Tax=Eragrostis curvula TaxID=38414 RepID=A0A5J9WBY1_9POAL|nr:hypothetical protein EJB05_04284 [Eragrostis curvula]